MFAKLPPVTGRRIRIAVVGCGRISRNHFGSIEAHSDELELVAVCDIDPVVADQSARERGVPGFTDLGTMLSTVKPDVVALCTPSGLHPEQAILAAGYGVHVISEKPMATRWEDGLRMVRACDAAGVRLFVVKQNRLNPTLQLLRKALSEGRFGRVSVVAVNVFWTRPQSYYDQGGWRGTWEFDGGALMNQASHYIDLLGWLFGPVATIHAMSSTARRIEAEDTAVLNLRWKSGALGSVAVTMLAYPSNLEGSITVLGEHGSVRIGGVAVNQVELWKFVDSRPYDSEVESASYQTTSVYGFGHPLWYGNVVRSLRGESVEVIDGREGLKSLELLIGAYRSARDGLPIALPLDR